VSQQINLFNPIFRQQKKYLSAATMVQALGLVLVGALLMAGYVNYRLFKIQATAKGMSAQLAAEQNRMAKVDAEYGPRPKDSALENEVQMTEVRMKALQKVEDILQKGDLGNTKGYAAYMRAFARQIVDGVWLTGFTIRGAGSDIAIEGRAVNPELIPVYIGRLKNEQVMKGKSFSNLEMQVPKVIITPGKPAEPAGYIEFGLRTVGLAAPADDGKGAKEK
jgi:hypothetical protein